MLLTYRTRIRVVGKGWDRVACGEENGYVINVRRDEFSVFCFHLALSEKTAVSSPGISLKVSMTRFVR